MLCSPTDSWELNHVPLPYAHSFLPVDFTNNFSFAKLIALVTLIDSKLIEALLVIHLLLIHILCSCEQLLCKVFLFTWSIVPYAISPSVEKFYYLLQLVHVFGCFWFLLNVQYCLRFCSLPLIAIHRLPQGVFLAKALNVFLPLGCVPILFRVLHYCDSVKTLCQSTVTRLI